MGIYSDNFYSWMERQFAAEKAAMDASAKFDESKHSREAKGSGKGGQFKAKPENIDKNDMYDPKAPPKGSPKGSYYRAKRDALASKVKEDGIYDLETGEPRTYSDGYQVSFQEETTERRGYGSYIEDEDYDRIVESLKKELGVDPDMGRYGEPEISFHVKDHDTAMAVARRHNQEAIWNHAAGEIEKNPDFVGRTHYADRDNHQTKHYRERK